MLLTISKVPLQCFSLNDVAASSIWTRKWRLSTNFRMDIFYIRKGVFHIAIFTLSQQIGAVVINMLHQILSHEMVDGIVRIPALHWTRK